VVAQQRADTIARLDREVLAYRHADYCLEATIEALGGRAPTPADVARQDPAACR
jgi:hypothetical protein